jgi:hypothetical protein
MTTDIALTMPTPVYSALGTPILIVKELYGKFCRKESFSPYENNAGAESRGAFA